MSTTDSNPAVDLDQLLAGTQLPALPQSAIRLLELSKDPENGPPEFAVPIEIDPGLTSQVLRFVNSSYFGFSQEISSVKLAITLVGIRTIKNFALWSAVFSLMPNPKCGQLDLRKLWQDSLRRALFVRSLARALSLEDAEAPFAAALLQDLAVPLLAKELPADYTALLEAREGGQLRLSELERNRFGWTHAEAGGKIARDWKLPEEFASLIERHTDLDQLLEDSAADPAQAIVALSALLPASNDETWHEWEAFEAAYHRVALAAAGPPAELLESVDEQYGDFAPVLDLASPSRSLAEWYRESTPVAP